MTPDTERGPMTETVGLRERIAKAMFDAFRDGFEEAYGERPEGWGETSEATREVWRKEADALLPTEGEPVAEVLSCGADEMSGPYMDVRPLGEPLSAGTKLYANTHLIHIEALLQNAWMAGFEHAMDRDEPTPEVRARQYAEHINRGGS